MVAIGRTWSDGCMTDRVLKDETGEERVLKDETGEERVERDDRVDRICAVVIIFYD